MRERSGCNHRLVHAQALHTIHAAYADARMTHDAKREMSRDMDSIIFSQTGRKGARTVGLGSA